MGKIKDETAFCCFFRMLTSIMFIGVFKFGMRETDIIGLEGGQLLVIIEGERATVFLAVPVSICARVVMLAKYLINHCKL